MSWASPTVHDMAVSSLTGRFGRALRRVRLEQNLSQEKLAAKAGVSMQNISEIERGLRDPSLTTLQKLARGLKLPITDLVSFADRDRWDRS